MHQEQIIVILILEWKVEGNMVSLQVLMLLGLLLCRAKTNRGQLKSNHAHYTKRTVVSESEIGLQRWFSYWGIKNIR